MTLRFVSLPTVKMADRPHPVSDRPPGWPWRRDDTRKQGWFIDGNSTRFGPLPEHVRFAKVRPELARPAREPAAPRAPIDPWRKKRGEL